MILADPDLRSLKSGEKPTRLPNLRELAAFLKSAKLKTGLRGEVNVLLTTDAQQKSLNKKFRGKAKTTDVLSFPAPAGAGYAGDLSISLSVARAQAAEHGHALMTELKVLMLHGVLHLCGHDHETDTGEMAALEEKLRARLGLSAGLIRRANAATQASRKAVRR